MYHTVQNHLSFTRKFVYVRMRHDLNDVCTTNTHICTHDTYSTYTSCHDHKGRDDLLNLGVDSTTDDNDKRLARSQPASLASSTAKDKRAWLVGS